MATTTGKRPKVASIQKTAVEYASTFLEDLPEKPKETFSLREAVNRLREQIQATLAKGYSYEEVAGMLHDKGIEISPSTLKNYVPSGRRQASKDAAAPAKPPARRGRKPQSSEAIATEAPSVAPPADTTLDTELAASSSAVDEAPAPPKRGRGRKKATPSDTTVEPAPEAAAPKRGRGRAKATAEEAPTTSPRSRGRTSQAAKAASADKSTARGRGRRKSS